ncbi:MAG: DUF6629 family protein [Bacteroidales bacterium]|jgi:hypothetical protein|nr:DUF6629 family protein [Bacteroidales bacterium]
MCFSASVSFGASAVITGVGVAAIKNSTDKKQLFFAMIPLLFGIQQFFEGWLWIALQYPGYESIGHFSKYGFLVFAELIWPIWIPLSIWLIEKDKRRKRLIAGFFLLGLIVGGLLAYKMIVYEVTAYIDQHHIYYQVGPFTSLHWSSGLLYLLPAVIPFLLSGNRHINYLGVMILLFFIISKLFTLNYLISVWCFFAAVLSIYIYFILKMQKRKNAV